MSDKASGKRPVTPTPRLFNRLVDAANYVEQRRLGKGVPNIPSPVSPACVKMQNNTGGDILRGAALQFSSNLLTSLSELDPDHLWFSGVLASADHKPFAIARRPMTSGDIDDCQCSGVIIARVNIVSTGHARAYFKAGETALESSDDGPVQILYAPGSTGVQECCVLLHNPTAPDANITVRNDSSYTVPPYGIMQITGTVDGSDELVFTIDRPSSTCGVDKYIVNTGTSIATTQYGKGTQQPRRIAYDEDDTDNDMSQEIQWGPQVDSFLARSGPVYWEFHGIAPDVGSTNTLWVGTAMPQQFIFKTPEADEENPDGIEAATYTGGTLTPAFRVLKVWEFNADGDLEETEQEEVVYNIDTTPVAADRFIQAKQERRTGRLIIDFEPCEGLTETEEE